MHILQAAQLMHVAFDEPHSENTTLASPLALAADKFAVRQHNHRKYRRK